MTTSPFHPDQLGPGSLVGPWRVLEPLGAGGFGRVFKVEHSEEPGEAYTLKVALRPVGSHDPEEEDVNGRLSREVAFHMAYETGRRVRMMDHWPTPDGYFYFVSDFVEGETFHEWLWRVQPTAAHLLAVFTEVVRVVGELHRRGVCHRDLKGDNILIRAADERPFLLDYGAARMPGMVTLTVGVPPASPHLLAPECIAFLGQGTWEQGAHFDPGIPGDMYALGALLYEALTDGYAFDPKLPYDKLVLAIATKVPSAPCVLNPKVPRTLSDIAMRLLAKSPADRHANTDELLQVLWDAAKEKKLADWQRSLAPPPETADPSNDVRDVSAGEQAGPDEDEEQAGPDEEGLPQATAARSRLWIRRALVAGGSTLLVFLALWLALSMLGPPPEKGSSNVLLARSAEALRSKPSKFLAAMLCASAGLACPGAPVKPAPGDCPGEAREAMGQVLGLSGSLRAVIDINQPGDQSQLGTYRDGPLVGRIAGYSRGDPALPDGTLLYGRLWTGPGIADENGREAVTARYTEARLPDGRTFPVCIVLGGRDGRVRTQPGSKAGAIVLPRELPVSAVTRWP